MSGLIWTQTADTLMVSSLLKEFYENADFEKSADDNKSMQTYRVQHKKTSVAGLE